jgi:serine/threonine protein kinase/Tol biopolymer transport system component
MVKPSKLLVRTARFWAPWVTVPEVEVPRTTLWGSFGVLDSGRPEKPTFEEQRPPVIGSTVSHYQILERLGGGGMGVVYKARDLKLGRLVALKFLSSQRGAPEEEKRRFLREARAASQIDHPNICTIHEIDETEDGALFIAMALYEGETLRDRLDRGPLPVPQAVDVAAQIAAGLSRAHEKGVVHRDVKPANVALTTDGQVKILDFGIARLSDQSRLTRAGMAVGTAAYMSPEQLKGALADPRSDIWALGVVIYEMVTGRLPFDDFSEREMVRAILGSDPPPLSQLRPGVPERLERIVARALARQPDGRYASMEALRRDLRSLAAPAAPEEGEADLTLLELPESASQAFRKGSPETREGLLGRTIGPYRVLGLLGGGGMGVVYKAEDTRLSRTVALKFLPPELTRDPEAKARFMQEARAASSLDHPNLCTILELGETPDGRLYLAMPCYDGETLRRKIERGPLPVAEAADLAEQVARGLAKAHRNGIIHRDVKPANLIVTGDGVVKILDFGLAKLAGSAAMTRTGSSMGTPAYMSPEQARGDEVDPRTDLWSLGVVLYEMLAGRRPFRGEGEQAVIHAILNQRPRPLGELRPETPPELARIADRLLARDPGDRYASAEEVFAGLRAFRGEMLTGTMLTRPAVPRRTAPWVWAIAVAALLLVAGGAGIWTLARGRQAPRTAPTFTRLTDQEGREAFPSLSPDGNFFVYAKATSPGNLDLYLQRTGGGNPINLTADSPVDDTQPAFSPDGQQIAFRSERDGGGVFVMGATGESVRRVTDFGFNPAWSPDGWKLVAATEGVGDPGVRQRTSQLWRVNLATGEKRQLPTGDAVQPSWSPHGTRIAFWGLPPGSAQRTIWTVDADGGNPVTVTGDPHLNWNPVWSPDGRFLYFASDRSGLMNLWRVRIDEESGRVEGGPEAVTTSSQESALLSFSRDGRRIVFAVSDSRTHLERTGFDPAAGRVTGAPAPVFKSALGIRSCRVSPDGKWIAFHSTVPREDLFVVRTDATGLRQLTDDRHNDRHPQWSPDGTRLLFYSDRSGRYEAWAIRPEGGGLEQLTRTEGASIIYPIWSPDGKRIAFSRSKQGLVLVDLTKPLAARVPAPVPVRGAGARQLAPSAWSRDGRRLAGNLVEGKSVGIGLYSFDSGAYEKLTGSGSTPFWLSDGRTLVFLDGGRVHAVDTFTRRRWELMAPAPDSDLFSVSASPDGRELYTVRILHEGDVVMLTME